MVGGHSVRHACDINSKNFEPMTLGNMRENGVCSLAITCGAYGHHAIMDVSGLADDVTVLSVRAAPLKRRSNSGRTLVRSDCPLSANSRHHHG